MTFPFRQPRLQLGPFRPDIPLAIDETHPLAKHVRAFIMPTATHTVDLVSGATRGLNPTSISSFTSEGYGSDGAAGLKVAGTPTGGGGLFQGPISLGAELTTFTFIECSEVNGGAVKGGFAVSNVAVGTGNAFFQSSNLVRVGFSDGTSWTTGPGPTLGKRLVRGLTVSNGVPQNGYVSGEIAATYSGSNTTAIDTIWTHSLFFAYDNGSVYEAAIVFDKVLTAAEHREIAANVYALTRPAIPMPVFTAAAATPNFDIPTTSYAVSLPTPTLTSQTAFSVPATSYTATLPAPSFTTATALDVPVTSYAETLPAPSFTTVTALDVPAISYAESLPEPSFTTVTAYSMPAVSYTVTLPVLDVSAVSTEAMQVMAGDWNVRIASADWNVRVEAGDWAVRIEAGDWKYDV